MRQNCSRRQFAVRFGAMLAPLVVVACAARSRTDALGVLSGLGHGNRRLHLSDSATLELVRVEAGQFIMGSPETEEGRGADERQHRVVLTKPFWLGTAEVTQGEWVAVMKTTVAQQRDLAQHERRDRAGSALLLWGEGPKHPIYYVSWDEAMAFCRRINDGERAAGRLPDGYRYSLPTEAQWEYACRAGSRGPFGAGAELDEMAWYDKTSNGVTHPVASKKPSAWGLHDMHGNVWEWCADYYGEYPATIEIDPTGPVAGADRVERGGRWANPARFCRSAQRNGVPGNRRYLSLGFRLALRHTGG
jgi:formylglycine-generating enzyme required for sulfatase activity